MPTPTPEASVSDIEERWKIVKMAIFRQLTQLNKALDTFRKPSKGYGKSDLFLAGQRVSMACVLKCLGMPRLYENNNTICVVGCGPFPDDWGYEQSHFPMSLQAAEDLMELLQARKSTEMIMTEALLLESQEETQPKRNDVLDAIAASIGNSI